MMFAIFKTKEQVLRIELERAYYALQDILDDLDYYESKLSYATKRIARLKEQLHDEEDFGTDNPSMPPLVPKALNNIPPL